MKDIANSSWIEKTLKEESFELNGITFKMSAYRQTEAGSNEDDLFKTGMEIRFTDNNHDAYPTVALQTQCLNPGEIKKFAMWLISNVDKIEEVADDARKQYHKNKESKSHPKRKNSK